MLRTRFILAAPARSATATWQTISDLVCDTVAVSPSCSRVEVQAAMDTAAPAGRMLVAGGHLEHLPVVLVAGAVHCEIRTISGAAALHTEENLNVIPGAATATTFTIHLPSPDPLGAIVADVAARHLRLSTEAVSAPQQDSVAGAALIDLAALRETVNRQ